MLAAARAFLAAARAFLAAASGASISSMRPRVLPLYSLGHGEAAEAAGRRAEAV